MYLPPSHTYVARCLKGLSTRNRAYLRACRTPKFTLYYLLRKSKVISNGTCTHSLTHSPDTFFETPGFFTQTKSISNLFFFVEQIMYCSIRSDKYSFDCVQRINRCINRCGRLQLRGQNAGSGATVGIAFSKLDTNAGYNESKL